MHFWGHLKTISHHRRLVRKYCFRLGLDWQGLTHDLSKYSPIEFWAGVKYFQGDRSPNDAQRRERGYSASWLHHKGRNRHHFEYWTDYLRDGSGTYTWANGTTYRGTWKAGEARKGGTYSYTDAGVKEGLSAGGNLTMQD